MTARQLVKGLTPPLLVTGTRRLRRWMPWRRSPEWEYIREGWARAPADLRGWNVESVLAAYRAKLPVFRHAMESSGPIAVSTSAAVGLGEASIFEQNTVLAFAYALALSSRHTDRVSVLDWGGGLGLFYFLSRALLPKDVEIDYHCKDVPLVCQYGRDAVPEVNFWDDDSCLSREYDLVFASSSLQYSQGWRDLVARLANASRSYLFLTQVPVVFQHPSFVVLQRTYRYTFDTEYLSWVFNRQELLGAVADSKMGLTREFLLGDKPSVAGAPEQDETRAFLFTHTQSQEPTR